MVHDHAKYQQQQRSALFEENNMVVIDELVIFSQLKGLTATRTSACNTGQMYDVNVKYKKDDPVAIKLNIPVQSDDRECAPLPAP